MATIENVNDRTILQQFHSLYERQNETETDVENLDEKIDQETIDRQTADLSINNEIQALRDETETDVENLDEKIDQETIDRQTADLSINNEIQALRDEIDAMNTHVETNALSIISLIVTKQDKLIAGTNITIDANNVISASGGTLPEHVYTLSSSTYVNGSSSIKFDITAKTFTVSNPSETVSGTYTQDGNTITCALSATNTQVMTLTSDSTLTMGDMIFTVQTMPENVYTLSSSAYVNAYTSIKFDITAKTFTLSNNLSEETASGTYTQDGNTITCSYSASDPNDKDVLILTSDSTLTMHDMIFTVQTIYTYESSSPYTSASGKEIILTDNDRGKTYMITDSSTTPAIEGTFERIGNEVQLFGKGTTLTLLITSDKTYEYQGELYYAKDYVA